MKNLILILFALITLNANAQLVVKEAAKDTVVWQASKLTILPKIMKFQSDDVESYAIYYRNAKYTSITDIDYITTGDLETSIQFYELCQSVINDDKEYNLELDGKNILLKKSMGSAWIWMDGSYFYLNSKYLTSILEALK
jgi:hypothetical protein